MLPIAAGIFRPRKSRSASADRSYSNGFTTRTPQRVKSSTFLVATINPWSFAVAAIMVSGAEMVKPLRWT